MATQGLAAAFLAVYTAPYTTSTSEDCPICLESIVNDNPVRITGVTGCNHAFGSNCLVALLNAAPGSEKRCPLCRTIWIPAEAPVRRRQSLANHLANLATTDDRLAAMRQAIQRRRGGGDGSGADVPAAPLPDLAVSDDETIRGEAVLPPFRTADSRGRAGQHLPRGMRLPLAPGADNIDDEDTVDGDNDLLTQLGLDAARARPTSPTRAASANSNISHPGLRRIREDARRAILSHWRLRQEMRMRLGREGEGDDVEVTAATVAALRRDIADIRARAGTWRNQDLGDNGGRAQENGNQHHAMAGANSRPPRRQSGWSPGPVGLEQRLDQRERELQERERALDAREQALDERERAVENRFQVLARQMAEREEMERRHRDELDASGAPGES